jgi:predicted RNA-binding Zn ribbon-like protein
MPAPFQLLAAHPVLDLVNTRDDRFVAAGSIELLRDYADLLRFAEQAGLLNQSRVRELARLKNYPAASEAFAAAIQLREALASVLYGALMRARVPSAEDMGSLERAFLEADQHQKLVWHSTLAPSAQSARAGWEWRKSGNDPQLPVWILARSAAQLLTSSAMNHVRVCDSETCRWLFLDTSKNHTRRWCDMKICGNRTKARRFQARHRG